MFHPPNWDDSLTEKELEEMHARVLSRVADKTPALERFTRQADALFVVMCNSLEDVMPDGITDCCELAEEVITSDKLAEEVVAAGEYKWNVDGQRMFYYGAAKYERASQIINSALAFRYLTQLPQDKPLTGDHLLEAHRLLMHNSVDVTTPIRTTPILAGAFRSRGVHARSGMQYADVDDIRELVDAVMLRLAKETADRKRQIMAIARAVHSLSLVHPFEHGNGRIYRMLAGVMVKRLSLAPFAVSMSCGDYEDAFRFANRAGDVGHLSTILLDAIDAKWCNYERLVELGM